METFSDRRFSRWAIVILVVLNLLTLTMLWIQNYKKKDFPKGPPVKRGPEEIQLFLERFLLRRLE